ncbi:MAG TPA: hypothetical protein VLS87_03780 [Woeseiaceae bacterium]|nr:hypothetical protein [Woeseiaceae bacterium]
MQDRLFAAVTFAVLAAALAGCASPGPSAGPSMEAGPPPFLALSITRQPSADFSGAPTGASVSTKENQVFAGLHRFGAGAGTLDLGLDYQYTRYVYDGIDGRNRDLHRFQFPLRYRNTRGGWEIDGSIAPGISTSSNVLKEFFDAISSDDLFATARFEARRGGAARSWVLGVAYDRRFGEPRVYPIAGIELSPSAALDLRLAFPDSAFHYRWSDRQSLSGRLFPAGHQWHVMTDDFSAEFDYRVEGFRAQLGWSARLWKAITLDVSGGYEFGRRHYLTDDLGVRIESAVEDQWLLLLGLRVGPAPLPYAHGGQL